MRSAFFEFHVAASGLFVARGGLEVVSHNTANAEIDGYSRQYAEMRANWPITYYDGKGMIGTGAEIYGVGQIRNFYLDTKYWMEQGVLGEYKAKRVQMGMLEKVMAELSGTGNTSGFNLFFQTLQDLSTTAGDPTYRTNVLQAAQGLTKFINTTTESMKKYQRDVNEEVKTVVQKINSLGHQIASLNDQISKFELDGSRANDLRDARARLVDELSQYVNVEVREVERNEDYAKGLYPEPEDRGKSQKEYYVMINGYEFVNHIDVRGLTTVARDLDTAVFPQSGTKVNPMDIDGLYDVYFEGGGGKFDIYHPDLQGQLKGLIDARDGNNSYYMSGSCTSAGNTITMAVKPDGRMDIPQDAPGTIQVVDSRGYISELRYSSYTYNAATGEATFTVDTALTPMPANAVVSATVGKTTSYKGIPHYLDKMNELVRTFTKAINEGMDRNGNQIPGVSGHMNGYDANGENLGKLFFTYGTNTAPITDYNLLTCENFAVNWELIQKPELLAAAKADDGISENKIILEFIELKHFSGMFAEGKIQDFVIGMAGELAVDVKQAKKFEASYTDLTVTIDNQRKSVSGVDLNEEMTKMIKYQQIYQASAKLINVIDGIYDTTINRMGVS